MQNPNQLAKDLSCWKWIWTTNRGDFLGVTIFTLILILLMVLITPESWWAYGIIVPIWYAIHIYRWYHLYKYNLKLYHNWQNTYAGMYSKKENNEEEQ